MKKIFLLLACAMTLGACNNDPDGSDPNYGYKYIGFMLFSVTTQQMVLNLEPMSVAFRLNALMVECENAGLPLTDLNNAPHKTELLGSSTIENSGQGGYKVVLSGKMGEEDFLRTGTIYFNTNGKPMSNGNSWALILPEENPYTVSISGIVTTMTASSYTIVSTKDNTWKLYLNTFVAKPSSQNSGSDSEETYQDGSNWSGTFEINQVSNPGDQSFKGISTSNFTVAIMDSPKVITAFYANELEVYTDEENPLVYTPACGNTITGGELVVAFTEKESLLNYGVYKWHKGTDACKPGISGNYHGIDFVLSDIAE